MMVADLHPPAPPSSYSPRSNALESLSLSHPIAVEDTSTQPLLPHHHRPPHPLDPLPPRTLHHIQEVLRHLPRPIRNYARSLLQ
ncbi:unnamed protein product [Musa acuminata subsp. burmannicoides]